MFKIFFNYLREQRTNVIQVLGLGFLVMIMILTFLSIQFSNQYANNQYFNDISHNTTYQKLNEAPTENNKFESSYNSYKAALGPTWLTNMNYYNEDGSIDSDKLKNATWQITLVNSATDSYRFTFNGSSDPLNIASNDFLRVGERFANKYGHNYIDFKLLTPVGYHEGYSNDEQYKNAIRAIINNYVFNESNPTNEVNYFITNNNALQIYQDEIYNKVAYANRTYDSTDITSQAQLYFLIINGMLFNNIEWNQYLLVTDLLITGKTFNFTQVVPGNVIDNPILVGNYEKSLEVEPLQDNEILMYQQFAVNNNLHIGDKYNIINHTFTIRGFATSRNSAYISNNIPGFIDPKNKTVAFINANTMNEINKSFAGFIDNNGYSTAFNPINPNLGMNPWLYQILHSQNIYGESYKNLTNGINFVLIADVLQGGEYYKTPYNYWVIFFLQERINLSENISTVFLDLIFVVTSMIILMVVWKMIHRNHKLIGILKAIGYKNWQLALVLVLAIICPLFIFSLLGICFSVIVSHILINSFSTYMALINYGWYFNATMSFNVLIIPLVLLVIISFIIIYLFLQKKPLDLITSKSFKKHSYKGISRQFRFVSQKIIGNVTYRNKLAITTSMRSAGKLVIICIVSIFAATLMLFSIAASGLVNDMLESQFVGIDFNYQNTYHFDDLKNKFLDNKDQLTYTFAPSEQVKTGPSLKDDLRKAIKSFLDNPLNPVPVICDVRNKYILGTELLAFRQEIEKPEVQVKLPDSFKKKWNKQMNIINYLTNNAGKNINDLLISFGIVPYEKSNELPYMQLTINESYDLDLSNNNAAGCQYDPITNSFNEVTFKNYVWLKQTMYGVTSDSNKFIKPNLINSEINNFANLDNKSLNISNFWLDKKFTSTVTSVKKALGITNINAPNVTFIPILSSSVPAGEYSTGNGNEISKPIIYPYVNFAGNLQYMIGIVYDGFTKLTPNIILTPQSMLNRIIGEGKNINVNNAKMSKLSDNELQHYLTFISAENDYIIDLTKIFDDGYIISKNIQNSLTGIIPVGNEKNALQNGEISVQLVILFFAVGSIVLSFTIMTLIANILVRDNWILINILKVIGYNSWEIAYNFIIIIVPLILLFSIFSVFVSPVLINVLAQQLTIFSNVVYPIIFCWWYFMIAFGTNICIYVIAYIITWFFNFHRYSLRKFMGQE